MTLLAIILVVVMAGFYSAQFLMTIGFVRNLNQWKSQSLNDDDCPRAAVILCFRGKDPFLKKCIQSLLQQDYPDYEVLVIVDHESDEAVKVVDECIRQTSAKNIKVEILKDRRKTCSLKCSSLLQAVGSIEDSREIVAMVDADAVPHATWLRELARAISRQKRWCDNGKPLVHARRFVAGRGTALYLEPVCYRPDVLFSDPLGGSLALRTNVIQETGLLDRWGRAFCEDTMLYKILAKQHLRVVFVPTLIMVNRDRLRYWQLLSLGRPTAAYCSTLSSGLDCCAGTRNSDRGVAFSDHGCACSGGRYGKLASRFAGRRGCLAVRSGPVISALAA